MLASGRAGRRVCTTRLRRPGFSKTASLKKPIAAQYQIRLASMGSTSTLLSQTLASVTNIKLSELTKRRTNFELWKSKLFRAVEDEPDQVKKLQLLVDSCSGELTPKVRGFLEGAKVDPSVSTEVMKSWQGELEEQIKIQSEQYKYAGLHGELIKEWLAEEGASKKRRYDTMKEAEREQLREQRQTWESYAFTPRDTDTAAIKDFLKKLFNKEFILQEAYKKIVKSTRDFEAKFNGEELNEKSMKWIIEGMLRLDSEMFTAEKREILKTFLHNKAALVELADVLNMKLKWLDTFEWHSEDMLVEQCRKLSGKYRFFQDEELLQSILVYWIGVKCAGDRQCREDFLGEVYSQIGNTVEDHRDTHFLNDIFLAQLQSSETPQTDTYSSESDTNINKMSSQNTLHHLLHVLAAEIILKKKQGGDLSVVRSDFRWFGPSLPHSTMFAVLSFLGVSDRWVNIFRRILEAPIKFAEDGPDGKVQIRKRGIPIGGPLGVMLGEMPLFCLDFAFNQITDGARLYRLYDDFWFWGDEQSCVEGWKVVSDFTKLTGLEINEDKTGSVTIGGSTWKIVNKGLPSGDVKWGFLKLDSVTGKFVIDPESVDQHIEHLRGQLASCESVFEWIRTWNIYGVRFFSNNFGPPAHAFGKSHVDAMIETFGHIQRKAFSSTGGSVTSTLREMLHKRFGTQEILDGYLYFPMSDGGLGVNNPIPPLLSIRKMINDPSALVQNALDKEKHAYSAAKKIYEIKKRKSSWIPTQFMSFEEFSRYRERTFRPLGDVYKELTVVPSAEFKSYDMYRSNMKKRFGGLDIVPKGMLPTGMINMFRKSRFQWKE